MCSVCLSCRNVWCYIFIQSTWTLRGCVHTYILLFDALSLSHVKFYFKHTIVGESVRLVYVWKLYLFDCGVNSLFTEKERYRKEKEYIGVVSWRVEKVRKVKYMYMYLSPISHHPTYPHHSPFPHWCYSTTQHTLYIHSLLIIHTPHNPPFAHHTHPEHKRSVRIVMQRERLAFSPWMLPMMSQTQAVRCLRLMSTEMSSLGRLTPVTLSPQTSM